LEVFEQFCENDNLWELEKAVDNYKVRYARMAKHFSYGPEVIFAYYLAKINAVTNVRIILTGKLAGLPTQAIRETLREVY
jgi:V/A-type H+-transporting ATPase subunit C